VTICAPDFAQAGLNFRLQSANARSRLSNLYCFRPFMIQLQRRRMLSVSAISATVFQFVRSQPIASFLSIFSSDGAML